MADRGAASIRAYTKVAIRRKGEASPFILVVVDLFGRIVNDLAPCEKFAE